MDTTHYDEWIRGKSRHNAAEGIRAAELSKHLFPHQRDLVSWALRRGRAAIFADTGLGKTAMQMEWARIVSERGRVIVLAPLAVAQQTVAEGRRFGVNCAYLREDDGKTQIVVANYEMLSKFDVASFAGVVLDESSILKAFDGKLRTLIIESFAATPFRLACTATPAPNDFTELGNHSEFLGVKSRVEMLAEYFVHDGGSTQDWRIKGHAIGPFWDWVATWGAIVKLPSDLGHDDGNFALPPLEMHEHVLPVDHSDAQKVGRLFLDDVASLSDARATRRATMDSRVARAAEIASGADPVLIWCELNDEADAVERAIPGSVQVAGSDDPDTKADRLLGFAEGRYRVLITKPKIAGFGMNWQHCANMIFLGASYSYEQTYQSIRRCWRFGQTRKVDVHVLRAENETAVIANYRRKEADAARLAAEMTMRVSDAVRREVLGQESRRWNPYEPQVEMTIPGWFGQEERA